MAALIGFYFFRWSIQPYWSQGAEKQYYVSKRCATEAECYQVRNHGNPLTPCHMIFFKSCAI